MFSLLHALALSSLTCQSVKDVYVQSSCCGADPSTPVGGECSLPSEGGPSGYYSAIFELGYWKIGEPTAVDNPAAVYELYFDPLLGKADVRIHRLGEVWQFKATRYAYSCGGTTNGTFDTCNLTMPYIRNEIPTEEDPSSCELEEVTLSSDGGACDFDYPGKNLFDVTCEEGATAFGVEGFCGFVGENLWQRGVGGAAFDTDSNAVYCPKTCNSLRDFPGKNTFGDGFNCQEVADAFGVDGACAYSEEGLWDRTRGATFDTDFNSVHCPATCKTISDLPGVNKYGDTCEEARLKDTQFCSKGEEGLWRVETGASIDVDENRMHCHKTCQSCFAGETTKDCSRPIEYTQDTPYRSFAFLNASYTYDPDTNMVLIRDSNYDELWKHLNSPSESRLVQYGNLKYNPYSNSILAVNSNRGVDEVDGDGNPVFSENPSNTFLLTQLRDKATLEAGAVLVDGGVKNWPNVTFHMGSANYLTQIYQLRGILPDKVTTWPLT